ncbi:MAG: endonuclease III [Armatimonadetes bacterium]|nr:endonuclease III [Armatimonadota bacterium]
MPRWTQASVVDLVNRLESIHGSSIVLHEDPLDELVSCILSQNTTDRNSFPCYVRLRSKYPGWSGLLSLRPEELGQEISQAGMHTQKSRAILGALAKAQASFGKVTLEPLRNWTPEASSEWLGDLVGVGPKTVAIVQLFALGQPAYPVDTHVERVSRRLGLVPPKASLTAIQHRWQKLTPPSLAGRLHLGLIQHGRHVCKARGWTCEGCVLRPVCKEGRRSSASSN